MKAIENLFLEFGTAISTRSAKNLTVSLEDAYKTTAAVIYADIAFKAESKIHIDKNNMDILNNDSAFAMLKREYRNLFKHPFR